MCKFLSFVTDGKTNREWIEKIEKQIEFRTLELDGAPTLLGRYLEGRIRELQALLPGKEEK
jgi:hypothetical protein